MKRPPSWLSTCLLLATWVMQSSLGQPAVAGLEHDLPPPAGPEEKVKVFAQGQEGYHTFRIPSLLVTARGTVLALCEGRRQSAGDSGDVDLVCRRSTDGGKTWSKLQTVWNDGPNTCGNPCPVVDGKTGDIWLLMTWNRGEDQESAIIAQRSKDTRRIFVSRSTDDGLTWSLPHEITQQVKPTNWTWCATGPGVGIQLQYGPKAGRLVIPCDHIEAGTQHYGSHVIYSDDQGESWKLGGSAPGYHVNECEVVELENGRLLLNMSEGITFTRFSTDWLTNRDEEQVQLLTNQPPVLNKAFISFRIGVPQWLWESRYHELLGWFEKYKGVTDEITFFTSATHPPLPVAEIGRRAHILAGRITQAKALGYRAGINVLATVGHHNENLANSLAEAYTRVTDPDGNVCQGSFCPTDPGFQTYVQSLYRVVADANPDYIWIDDDVRLAGHMPIGLTCFCDRCLARFETEAGAKFTRSDLKSALFEGPLQGRLALRKEWLAHNRATIQRFLELVEQTVHQQRPGLPLGFMTRERFYEGYDFDAWARALAGVSRAPVYWRPGGGFYKAASSLAVFENRLGGRVAVSGYFAWSFLHSLSKTAQMKSVMRWLSHDRLSAYVASFHKANVWVREARPRELAVALINSSFDPASNMDVVLLTTFESARMFDMKGNQQTIRAARSDGPYRHFMLPIVDPWTMRLLICGRP